MLNQTDIIDILYMVSLPFVVASLAGFVLYTFKRSQRVFNVATLCSLTAFLGLTAVLLILTVRHGVGMPLVASARYLMCAWLIMLIYFVAEKHTRVRLLGSILMPAALALMLVAMFVDSTLEQGLHMGGAMTALHVVCIFTAFAMITLSFGGAVMYLIKTRHLKDHRSAALDEQVPALNDSAQLMESAFNIAFPVLSAGLVLGVAYAAATLSGDWYLEQKILWGLGTWLVYAVLFCLRHNGRLTTMALARGIAVVFAIIAVSFIFTRHKIADPDTAVDPPQQYQEKKVI